MDQRWARQKGDSEGPLDKKSGVSMSTVHRGRSARAVVGVGMLSLALVVSGCGESAKDVQARADKALNEALALQASGQEGRARDKYQEVLDAQPSNKYAIYNIALLDQLAGKNDSAEGKYRVVIKLDPAFEPALYNLGVIVGASGRTVEAIDLYRRAIAARPSAANAHFNLALLLRHQGDKAGAAQEMLRALSLDPKLTDPAAKPNGTGSSTSRPTPTPTPTG